jgi:hypothetical protein
MGKVVDGKAYFVMEPGWMLEFMPRKVADYCRDNWIDIECEDFEGCNDEKYINVPYLEIELDAKVVAKYLIKYEHISDESKLENYLQSVYLPDDFYYLDEFIGKNKLKNAITNYDEVYKAVRVALKQKYGFEE